MAMEIPGLPNVEVVLQTYDWKITAQKAGAWAGATFLAGVLGAVEAGELRPKVVINSGALALLVGVIQGLRNWNKNKRPQLAIVPPNPKEDRPIPPGLKLP